MDKRSSAWLTAAVMKFFSEEELNQLCSVCEAFTASPPHVDHINVPQQEQRTRARRKHAQMTTDLKESSSIFNPGLNVYVFFDDSYLKVLFLVKLIVLANS